MMALTSSYAKSESCCSSKSEEEEEEEYELFSNLSLSDLINFIQDLMSC